MNIKIGDKVYITKGSFSDKERYKAIEGVVVNITFSIPILKTFLSFENYKILYFEDGVKKIEGFNEEQVYLKSHVDKLQSNLSM